MSLRLDPRLPVVWRTPASLQIGIDQPTIVCESISTAEERMLEALKTGISPEGLAMIGAKAKASPQEIARFVQLVKPVLASATNQQPPLSGLRIVIVGTSRASSTIRTLLTDLGADCSTEQNADSSPDLALLVGAFSLQPTTAAFWLRRDIPHLAIIFSDQEVRIGPLVEPGSGPCLHCIERFAIDADPAWPAMASQLLGRAAATETALSIAEVLPLIARACIARVTSAPSGLRNTIMQLNTRDGTISEKECRAHPDCHCQALPETSMEGARENDPLLFGPTTKPIVPALE